MIARLREQQTLDALDSLVVHLDGLRPERKFVMVFTEGWPLYRPDRTLSRVLEGRGPVPIRSAVDPRTGGIRQPEAPDPATGKPDDRQELRAAARSMLAQAITSANSWAACSAPIAPTSASIRWMRAGCSSCDNRRLATAPWRSINAMLRERHDICRTWPLQTDGHAVLEYRRMSAKAMQKIFRDVGSYYLLSYYSTNQKLDGRFRRIRVEVKRPDVDVRARPGYLAPTEAEARAAGAAMDRRRDAARPPPTVTRALDALAPARGNLPVRVQAVGARNSIRAIVELDAATVKQPEWMSGGTLRVTFEPEKGRGTKPARRRR